jgi:hypothetical protein
VLKAARELKEAELVEETQRCACHTLHLCVTHALESPSVAPILTKVKSIVTTIRRSNLASETLVDEQKALKASVVDLEEVTEVKASDPIYKSRPLQLLLDVSTRWSSTFRMLERVLHLKLAVNITLMKHAWTDKLLTESEWRVVTDLVALLRPVAKVVKDLEGDQYPTLSLVWPAVLALSRFLRGHCPEFTHFPDWRTYSEEMNAVRNKMLEEMSHEDRFKKPSDVMRIATCLDPRYKDLEFVRDNTRMTEAYTLLLSKLQAKFPHAPAAVPPAPTPAAETMDVDDIMVYPVAQAEAPVPFDDAVQEFNTYRRLPPITRKQNPYEWWKIHSPQIPRLALLARMYLALPASSAPSERVFSRLNVTVHHKRTSLKSHKVEKMVIMSCNRKLVKRLRLKNPTPVALAAPPAPPAGSAMLASV